MKKLYIILVGLMLVLMAHAEDNVGNGVPFFRNFSASEYHANNRNFDVECDHKGNVFVANFEGLLYYNGVEWSVWHSRGNSRITKLYESRDGYVWFGGYNVLGRVRDENGTIVVDVVSDEKTPDVHFGVVQSITERGGRIYFSDQEGKIFCVKNHQVEKAGKIKSSVAKALDLVNQDRLTLYIPNRGMSVIAVNGEGLYFRGSDGQLVYHLDSNNGLCSNVTSSLSADDKGTVWGTTNNGIFAVAADRVYSHYSDKEGLVGQVTTILEINGKLFVGTLQGLFVLEDERFIQVPGTISGGTCWQLAKHPDGGIIIAMASGLYTYRNQQVRQLSSNHTLSVYIDNDGSILAGELDCLRRYYTDGRKSVSVQNIPNVSRLEGDGHGGVWAISLDKNTYHKPVGARSFTPEVSKTISVLWDYRDDRGKRWHSNRNGKGLTFDGVPKKIESWLRPLAGSTVTTMYLNSGLAWIGGNFGLIRMNLDLCQQVKMSLPKAYIRDFRREGNNFYFNAATDRLDPIGTTLYSYSLHDGDEYSREKADQTYEFPEMPSGDYTIRVKAIDPSGNVTVSEPIRFYIPSPIYLRWYAWVLYFIVLGLVVFGVIQWRLLRIEQERQRLERIVSKRTAELNQANGELNNTLSELKNAQNELIRQEKEATVGKLTKGLIDRILNPLNYINNFSHLSLGLTKDMSDDMDDAIDALGDNVNDDAQDAFDDMKDVLGMMHGNLEKIEQHGMATTRILKAMEEMLRERGGKVEAQDIAMLCQTDADMLRNYFSEDISKMNISVVWQKPEYPIVADVVADELSKVIMSMLANSVYAVKKKWEKAGGDYKPVVKLEIIPPTGTEAPTIHIWDNGIGIEESIIDKIFDPFFTTKPTGEAPGVGLYLSRLIVEDVGGKITVESVKNEWTEFRIELP